MFALPTRRPVPLIAAYELMIGGAALVLMLITNMGSVLSSTASSFEQAQSAAPATDHGQLRFLITMLVIMAAAPAMGALFRWLRQPPVVGEVLAGIMLGPSLLGAVFPSVSEWLLLDHVVSQVGVVAQLGILLYMFTVGLEFDLGLLQRRGHSAVAISHASILTPLMLGAALAIPLYARFSSPDVPFAVFALFLGVAMSVTAFPVLARILTDCQIHKTTLGSLAMTCAAVDDVTAWCLLALVVGMARAQWEAAVLVTSLTLVYGSLMLLIARPLVSRWVKNRKEAVDGPVVVAMLLGLFASATVTEWIGIHAIFGAFLWGAIIPQESHVARVLTGKLKETVSIVLLPAFFALAGMRTEIGLISGWGDWAVCGVIIAVASVGKIGGSALAARITGMSWRDSGVIGALMNTRGLMELVVLSVGLELGVITPQVYTLLVIMALATTVATAPLLSLLGLEKEPSSPALLGD
jgi:Kef-type K+ transport system membrane component KefB